MADAELFGRYRDALDTNATLVQSEVRRLIESTAGMDADSAYAYVLRNYPKLVRAYGRVAADVARRYYQDQRDEYDMDEGFRATAAGDGEASWYEDDVGQAFGRIEPAAGHNLATPEMLPGRAIQRVMGRADRTIDMNLASDPVDGLWAVVPHPGACGFCVMVGANGFTYHSEASADAQRHPNCRCAVCVDFGSRPELDGYDPSGLYDVYDQAARAARPEADERWAAMSAEERASYGRRGRSAKDVFRTKLITAEIDRMTGHSHDR